MSAAVINPFGQMLYFMSIFLMVGIIILLAIVMITGYGKEMLTLGFVALGASVGSVIIMRKSMYEEEEE